VETPKNPKHLSRKFAGRSQFEDRFFNISSMAMAQFPESKGAQTLLERGGAEPRQNPWHFFGFPR
jgi:hypothetical protein